MCLLYKGYTHILYGTTYFFICGHPTMYRLVRCDQSSLLPISLSTVSVHQQQECTVTMYTYMYMHALNTIDREILVSNIICVKKFCLIKFRELNCLQIFLPSTCPHTPYGINIALKISAFRDNYKNNLSTKISWCMAYPS